MPIHSIGTFVSAFNGGTRPNRFKVTGTAPIGGTATTSQLFGTDGIYCLASALPESIVGIIPIPFRGRIYKFPGDRSYNEWTVTMLDDTGGVDLWKSWHDWSEKFNSHELNIAADPAQKPNYCEDLTIDHLDHASDGAIRTVMLKNAWPVQVGPVQLDMSAANTLTQFQVQIAYTYYSTKTNNIGIARGTAAGPPAP